MLRAVQNGGAGRLSLTRRSATAFADPCADKRWNSGVAYSVILTAVTRSRPIPTKRMGSRCAKPCAEKRVTFPGLLKRHLSVVFRCVCQSPRIFGSISPIRGRIAQSTSVCGPTRGRVSQPKNDAVAGTATEKRRCWQGYSALVTVVEQRRIEDRTLSRLAAAEKNWPQRVEGLEVNRPPRRPMRERSVF
jgi:hypothetical protein